MSRPERPAPGGESPERAASFDGDARAVARLLAPLREDTVEPQGDLAQRVARRVRNRISLHDLIEITTRAPFRALLPLVERLIAPFSRRSGGGSEDASR